MDHETRIPLLEKTDVSPEIATLYERLLAQRGVVPNMFKALAHTPAIAQGVAGFLTPLLSDGALPGWYKELVAIRVSIFHQSDYAVRAHSASARKKGATEEQVASVADFESGPYTAQEKSGFRAADLLHAGAKAMNDAAFAELAAHFSPPQLVELFLTAAAFEMFPRFVDGLRIPVTQLPASAAK